MLDTTIIIIKKIFEHIDLIIPTALTILGWRFVYSEGNRLAKRNEALNLFHISRKILENINNESEKIWLSSGANLSELDDAKLTAFCVEFERCINQIKKHYCDLSINIRDISNLRRALTCSPYPINGQAATNEKRIKEIKIIISEISLRLLDSTYETINKKNNSSR